MNWFRKWFGKTANARHVPTRPAVPRVERLESREVMTVTYHGGALLHNVKIEPYYYGQNWNTNSGLQSQRTQLTNYLGALANGPYTDMLNKAGYNVARGTTDFWWNTYRVPGSSLDDTTIQGALQADINAHNLQTPDANRLYTVFVQPGTVVTRGGSNSLRNFDAYHDSFNGSDGHGHAIKIIYAVMPYPGAGTGFFSGNGNAFDSLTDVTSHEVAEAITNPDYRSAHYGWNDDHYNGQNTAPASAEVGDITEFLVPNYVRLSGYAVTKISDKNDRAMVPAELAVSGVTFHATLNQRFSGAVANGSDTTLLTHGTNLTATVVWGDGSTSAGTVGDDGHGHYPVTGTHTYTRTGTFSVRVTLQDRTNSIGTAGVTTSETVGRTRTAGGDDGGDTGATGKVPVAVVGGDAERQPPTADVSGSLGEASAFGVGVLDYKRPAGWQQLTVDVG